MASICEIKIFFIFMVIAQTLKKFKRPPHALGPPKVFAHTFLISQYFFFIENRKLKIKKLKINENDN